MLRPLRHLDQVRRSEQLRRSLGTPILQIAKHLEAHGSVCRTCDEQVPTSDLTLDHIFPWAKGGLTSRFNAEVMCRSCNSSKGANAGVFAYVRGRAA